MPLDPLPLSSSCSWCSSGCWLRAGSGVPGSGGSGPGHREDVVDSRVVALVELAKAGDREAFGKLYDAYVDTVFRYLFLRVGGRALAEDFTSETFLRALRRIYTFKWQGHDIAAWFITIARNLVSDHAKSARFRLELTTADMRDADVRCRGTGRPGAQPPA